MATARWGKIALIAGARSGIGLAIAKRFAAEGAQVILAGRRQAELDAAVGETWPTAFAVQTNVREYGFVTNRTIQRLFDRDTYGLAICSPTFAIEASWRS